VIVLRFFGGLTISDTSVHLGIAVSQVRSAQAAGESWLKDAIENVL
jgi:DNA-directed RNA polymerase specialized sigma24 family protein